MDSLDYYERYAIPYYEETIDLDMSEVMQPFIEQMPEGAEVLDLGCGSGRDTVALEEQGYLVTPMDGSLKMCELAEIHTNHDVLHLRFDEMDFDEVFDGIWACASLLHVPESDIPGVMQKVLNALKPGGVLYFSVYEGDREGFFGGRYYCDYTKAEIRKLIGRFPEAEILDIWRSDSVKHGEDRQFLNVLVKKEEA